MLTSQIAQFELKTAMGSAAALISYLGLLSDAANLGNYNLRTHDLGQFMRLDSSAIRALHLMPDPNGMSGNNKNSSLFGILNKCRTAQGTRLLSMWLKQPLVNLHEIRAYKFPSVATLTMCAELRQDLVECFVEDAFLRQTLQVSHQNARHTPTNATAG